MITKINSIYRRALSAARVISHLLPLTSYLLFLFYSLNLGAQRMTESLHKLQYAEMVINSLYVDSVDEAKLAEDGIRGMLSKLDPHSSYSTPKEVKELKEPLDGNFEGIGVQFNMMEDTLIVIQPVSNGPSERVGIIAGDRIVSVNDTAIAGVKMSKEEIMKRLRGPKGTKVELGVVRQGIGETLKFTVAGSADSATGTKAGNQALSQKRADYIFNLLTDKYGLTSDNFTVKALGGVDTAADPQLDRAVYIENN